jgi:tRNA pseudouridine32 synthase/23S rRNA pseudouridine746 synthase
VRILHHDRHLVVVDKPAGLLSVPGIGPEKADCLVSRLQAEAPGARIVHRLDFDTSGVIVLALDADIHRELSRQFQDREVGKRYIAVVAGRVAGDSGEVDLPLRKEALGSARQIVHPTEGKPSVTRWTAVERLDAPPRTRLALEPLTGRSHQLRVHCLALGHPILGDPLYGTPESQAAALRLLLHAERLEFTHPSTGGRMSVASPTPF